MSNDVRILILEDDPADATATENDVQHSIPGSLFYRVATTEAFEASLASFRPDLILAACRPPHTDCAKALAVASLRAPDVPFIVTGSASDNLVEECLRAGAWDFVLDKHAGRLGPAVKAGLEHGRARREQKRAEEELRFHSRGFHKVANAAIDLAEVTAESDMCQLIVRILRDLAEASIATFGLYDPATKRIHVKRAAAQRDVGQELVGLLAGTALAGSSYPLSDATWQEILATPIGYRITLGEAAFGVAPDVLKEAARKLPGTYRFTGIAYWLDGQLYGTSLVALRADTPEPPRELLRLFAQMVAATVRRVRMESALRESEIRFKSIFEAANAGKSITLPTGEIVVNRAFCDLLGYTEEELRGRKWQDLTPTEDIGLSQAAIDQLLAGEKDSVRFTKRYLHKNGSVIWADVSSAVQRGPDGNAPFLVTTIVDITERRRAQEALIESESRYRSLMMNSPDAVLVAENQKIVLVNHACCRLFGADSDVELIGKSPFVLVHPDFHEQTRASIERMMANGEPTPLAEAKIVRFDGEVVDIEFVAAPFRYEGRSATHVILRDVTAHHRMEERLRQSQKMETVGQLAGGVAHDFNNMLQVISSYAEMALAKVEDGQPLHKYLQEIRRAAQRSAEITGQLLTFARKQTVSPRVLEMNEAVVKSRKMLQRLIGENIDLAWVPGQAPLLVRIDPAQLDQVLANIAVNARDAIDGVGRLEIGAERAAFDDAWCASHQGFLPGEFVHLSLRDDGCGMDAETMSHLFEPFFTTKSIGKGTGLGLATIYGIVKQNNGFLTVDSAPGKGSTFHVYLPRSEGAAPAEHPEPGAVFLRGTETILVVEDEGAILRLAAEMLRQLGYSVLTARSPEEALRMSGTQVVIDLLVTDVILPQMNGRELAALLARDRPGLKCLYMSGYTADIIAQKDVAEAGTGFLAKPFSLAILAERVRDLLDRP